MDELDLERLVLPALLALLVLGALLILVTNGSGNDSLVPADLAAPKTAPARQVTTPKAAPQPVPASTPNISPSRRFVKVQPGDSAGSIATSAGVSVDRLKDLNPSLDFGNLRPGQTLKLAR